MRSSRSRPTVHGGPPGVGAYGFRVTGAGAGARLLGTVPDRFPPLHLAFIGEPTQVHTASVDDEWVVFALDHGRGIVVDRGRARATIFGHRLPTAADVVHPLLTAAAAAAGRWSGYELLHAAAFVVNGHAWGLLGDKKSGKSTVAAWLAQRGYPVICDDMLAITGRTAFAGPRCVDLRPEPARRLGIGRPVATDGPRERWRVTLPSIDPELLLGGWVFLSWGEPVEAVPVKPRHLLGRLAASRTWPGQPVDPVGLLDLATLPAWDLRRPPTWESFDRAAETLEEITAPSRPARPS